MAKSSRSAMSRHSLSAPNRHAQDGPAEPGMRRMDQSPGGGGKSSGENSGATQHAWQVLARCAVQRRAHPLPAPEISMQTCESRRDMARFPCQRQPLGAGQHLGSQHFSPPACPLRVRPRVRPPCPLRGGLGRSLAWRGPRQGGKAHISVPSVPCPPCREECSLPLARLSSGAETIRTGFDGRHGRRDHGGCGGAAAPPHPPPYPGCGGAGMGMPYPARSSIPTLRCPLQKKEKTLWFLCVPSFPQDLAADQQAIVRMSAYPSMSPYPAAHFDDFSGPYGPPLPRKWGERAQKLCAVRAQAAGPA